MSTGVAFGSGWRQYSSSVQDDDACTNFIPLLVQCLATLISRLKWAHDNIWKMESTDATFWAFACSYLSLCIIPLLDSSFLQRRCFRRVRQRFAEKLHLRKLREHVSDDDVEGGGPSWRLLPLAYELIMFIQGLSQLYEGRIFITANIAVVSSLLGWVAARGSYRTMIWSGRLAFFQHFTTVYSLRKSMALSNDMIIRAIFTRSLGALCFSERLDETFLQLLSFSWIFSLDRPSKDPIILLPMKVWFLLVFPINILGLREWVASSAVLLGRSPVKLSFQLFAAVSLPLMVLFLAPLSMSANQRLADQFIATVFFVNVLWGVFNYLYSERIDATLMSSTLGEMVKASTMGKEFSGMPSTSETEVIVRTASLATAVGLISIAALLVLSSIVIWANGTLSIVYFVGLVSFASVSSGTLKLEYLRKNPSIARYIFGVQCTILLIMSLQRFVTKPAPIHELDRLAMLALIASRLVMMVDYKRVFSGLQIEAGTFFAMTCFAAPPDADLFRLIVAGSVTCSLVGAFVVMARERTWQIIYRDRASHAFLSHALKQKYAGVGSAVEEAMGHLDNLDGLDGIIQLLKDIQRECRRGHDACHAVNILGNARSHRYIGGPQATSTKCIRTEIDAWCARGVIDSSKVRLAKGILSRHGTTDVQVHWELLKALFIHFICRQCSVNVDSDEKEVSIRVHCKQGLSQDDVLIIACIAETLQATSKTHNGFSLQIVTKPKSDVTTVALPKHLRYAVLDDTALVRMSVKRTLEMKLDADPSSFYRGADEAECLRFPLEVKTERPDIVLLDEHLVDDLRGSDIARSLRNAGYEGCILLHSATTLSSDSPLDACFDGLVEKTSSKDDFVNDIARGWQGFMARRTSRRSRADSMGFSSSSSAMASGSN